jgi:hypothetical protein
MKRIPSPEHVTLRAFRVITFFVEKSPETRRACTMDLCCPVSRIESIDRLNNVLSEARWKLTTALGDLHEASSSTLERRENSPSIGIWLEVLIGGHK